MPITALAESCSMSCTPGRPPRAFDAGPSARNTRPESLSSATRVETVVRDRPVVRAISAWLVRPCIRRTSITRSRLRSRSHASVPSPFLVLVLLSTPCRGNHGDPGLFVKTPDKIAPLVNRSLDKPPSVSNALRRRRVSAQLLSRTCCRRALAPERKLREEGSRETILRGKCA